MNALFAPAVALMGRLKISVKFGLVSLIFLLPLVLTETLLVSNIQTQIAFTKKERLGIEYIVATEKLLKDIQQHRGMVSALRNGDNSFQQKINAKQGDIGADLESITIIDQKHSVELKSTERWQAVVDNWKTLKQSLDTLNTSQNFDRHTALVTAIIDHMSYIGDESNLTLDTDIDSYYLMDTFVNKLPLLTETMGQTRGFGVGVITRKQIQPHEKAHLQLLAAQAREALNAARKNIGTAFRENASLKDSLEAPLQTLQLSDQFLTLVNEGVIDAASIAVTPSDYFALASRAIDNTFALNDVVAVQLDNLLQLRIAKIATERNQVFAVSAVALLLAVYLLLGFFISVKKTVSVLTSAVSAVAAGDLSGKVQVVSRDEIGAIATVLDGMVGQLSTVIGDVRSASDALASASEEVSATAQSLAQASSEQASGVDDTSASIEQMTASIAQTSENAKVTDDIAAKASSEAEESREAMTAMINAMHQITQKISIIDDIAYQTNLLALNAAIEAARAGTHGRGFAIVAAEVRKLAERSQAAAQNIEQVASASTEIAERASQLLYAMVPNIRKTSDLIQEINAAAQEQSSGANQINSAIFQVRQTTQSNAAASEQLAATAEEMSGQAQSLRQVMERFKTKGEVA
ncbi:MAG: hypothetical protein JWM78_1526 [Verrucomicrobiaceae bacterium]|nr:hypothetical protein [Verrucomicrobiaceae bacterium]